MLEVNEEFRRLRKNLPVDGASWTFIKWDIGIGRLLKGWLSCIEDDQKRMFVLNISSIYEVYEPDIPQVSEWYKRSGSHWVDKHIV